MTDKYKNIINLPHHTSSSRPHMPRADRAAQFAPYSALSGYEDAVDETARLTDGRTELDEDEKELINRRLVDAVASPLDRRFAITFFLPDGRKSGGAYITSVGEIAGFDEIKKRLTLYNGRVIPIEEIIAIEEVTYEQEK